MKKPAAAAGLAAYYSRFGQAAACLALHPRYEDCGIAAKRTRAFAEAVGARVELKIEKATCRENPQWDYLRSVGADHNTSPSDRDWHIPKLAEWSPCGSYVINGWQSLVLQSISRRTRSRTHHTS